MKFTSTAAALLVSSLSLCVAAWSIHETNENAKLAARPYAIVMSHVDKSGKRIGLFLSNAGLGPALIKSMTIAVDGRVYSGLGESIWPQFIRDMKLNSTCFRTGWPDQQAVLRVGEEDPLLVLGDIAPLSCQRELGSILAFKDVKVEMQYASIFDENFHYEHNVRIRDAMLRELMMQ